MAKPRWLLSVAVLAAGAASAAGFGPSAQSALLGQPLDFAVQLRLDPGEALSPECVGAEVTVGERRVQQALVRTVLEMTGPETARVRVLTSQSMDEPVIGVQLQVGCLASRMSRRFVVLADPPLAAATPVMAAVPLAVASSGLGPTASALAASSSAEPPARAGAATAGGGETAADVRPTANSRLRARPAPARREARNDTSRRDRRAARSARNPQASVDRVARATTPPIFVAAAASPRLKLESGAADSSPDSAEDVAVEQAMQAVAAAASAARAAASAASAAEQRIASLERTVEQLRIDSKASRDQAAQMRERLSSAESSGGWFWPLLLGLLLLAAMATWLALRLASLQRERAQHWHRAADPSRALGGEVTSSKQPTAPIPFVTSEIAMPAPVAQRARPGATPAWPPPAPVDPGDTLATAEVVSDFSPDAAHDTVPGQAVQRTVALPPNAQAAPAPPFQAKPQGGTGDDSGSARDVSIEELIDLEQQAEFFVVLGQDDAAIGLLVEHLRSTGGGSPLPYLKLLEIFHRRGDRDDYERTRMRFNHRFNAYAPDWDAGLQHGRTLEDYTGIVPRLQQVWPRPLDAMAELEALLFRKSRGDLFDLPAYRDVLFLYSLARDLLDREAADTGNVDLLLPLADGGEFSATAPHPYFGLDHDSVFDGAQMDDRPTAPIDLDLSLPERQPSIFDPMDTPAPRR